MSRRQAIAATTISSTAAKLTKPVIMPAATPRASTIQLLASGLQAVPRDAASKRLGINPAGVSLNASVACEIKHFSNRLAAKLYLQCFPVIAGTFADITLDIDIRQEVHLDLDDTVT